VLAVVLVTAILLGATINFYINLSRQARTRVRTCGLVRRASACSTGSPSTSSTRCS
jgi:hypothetical protein